MRDIVLSKETSSGEIRYSIVLGADGCVVFCYSCASQDLKAGVLLMWDGASSQLTHFVKIYSTRYNFNLEDLHRRAMRFC